MHLLIDRIRQLTHVNVPAIAFLLAALPSPLFAVAVVLAVGIELTTEMSEIVGLAGGRATEAGRTGRVLAVRLRPRIIISSLLDCKRGRHAAPGGFARRPLPLRLLLPPASFSARSLLLLQFNTMAQSPATSLASHIISQIRSNLSLLEQLSISRPPKMPTRYAQNFIRRTVLSLHWTLVLVVIAGPSFFK